MMSVVSQIIAVTAMNLRSIPQRPGNSLVVVIGVAGVVAVLTSVVSPCRHRLDDFRSVHAKAILGGLHHEYSLARA